MCPSLWPFGPNKGWPNVFAGGLHMFEIHSVFPWNFHLLKGNFVQSPGMNFFSGEGLTPEAPWTRSIIYIGICICLIMSLKGIGYSFIWFE